MRGSSYDGASVMSGNKTGLQARIKDIVPWALYVHCYAHKLNLIVVDACKATRHAADFFALLQEVYNFVSGSCVHAKWIELQKTEMPDQVPIELKRLCKTRWTAQIRACDAVKSGLPILLD